MITGLLKLKCNIMQLAYNLAAHQLEDASHIFEQLKEKKKEDDKPINRF